VHGTFCGSTLPQPITSDGNKLRITFSTDNTVQKTGFSAVFFTGIFCLAGLFADFATYFDLLPFAGTVWSVMSVHEITSAKGDVIRARERSVNGGKHGADRAENRVSGSGAVSGHSRKRLSGNGARSGRQRSGERVSKDRLER